MLDVFYFCICLKGIIFGEYFKNIMNMNNEKWLKLIKILFCFFKILNEFYVSYVFL